MLSLMDQNCKGPSTASESMRQRSVLASIKNVLWCSLCDLLSRGPWLFSLSSLFELTAETCKITFPFVVVFMYFTSPFIFKYKSFLEISLEDYIQSKMSEYIL